MSAPPPPGDPDEDDPAPRPPGQLLGLRFWLLIAFAVVCIAAGLGVARLGPVLFPAP
ncbi:MAG: hypothetical protein Q8N19_12785 [Phenylobacterium sp.]|uniref:hypothetical protein n=1 Tax=Phenylobacterium sp. TaxID=1871053 RepID=UPI0027346C6E|nr:hypothetical protein [Phenylobacterium sp.]MDP3117976.1 hypothetical protein [Phenylobacterium sp.]